MRSVGEEVEALSRWAKTPTRFPGVMVARAENFSCSHQS